LNSFLLNLAERVIQRSDRDHPADAVLRAELKTQRDLLAQETAELSHAVFSYFRWYGWLSEGDDIHEKILQAIGLAKQFSEQPKRFADHELVARAVPAWIHDEISITPAFARALQTEPKLWLRARPGQGTNLAERLGDCRPFGTGALADTLMYFGKADLFRTPEFHSGDFELQDISSQAVGFVCAPEPRQTWWDACAGEGGKLLHLSDLMRNQGLIWASDRAEWRLRRLKRRTARARVFNYRAALWDGGPKLPTKGKFDGVLIDAPCSGTGTWQRNPHARWTLLPSDVKELKKVQLDLLTHAGKAVKPGGKLVYSVCSLARSETSDVVEEFENLKFGFTPLQVRNPLADSASAVGTISFWPQDYEGNGMFIAAWIRDKANEQH
jgi:16S rRNA (cytosine967-C5)-methyltransferase